MSDSKAEFSGLVIENPKVYSDSVAPQESRLFPYYAGYSSSFAIRALQTLGIQSEARVLDPWNGSGTTTLAATQLGHRAVGQDLNPAMVLVAKAGLLAKSEASSLLPLARTILDGAAQREPIELHEDALTAWFSPSHAEFIRRIEAEINQTLISHQKYAPLTDALALSNISSLAAYFYVSLFRATRRLLIDFIPSNPTWVKTPSTLQQRKRPNEAEVCEAFLVEVSLLSNRLHTDKADPTCDCRAEISLGNAEHLRLPDQSIDAVITSPPYCTRIDYAVATSIELAVLRISKTEFDSIRRSLMGTSTVSSEALTPDSSWGNSCLDFLGRLNEHPSKASKTYYFRNHLQYFRSLNRSIQELQRVLVHKGKCLLVVQDSYYKDLKNDVPCIAVEMAEHAGLSLGLRRDFPSSRSMAAINRRAREYIDKRTTTESVLCFIRM